MPIQTFTPLEKTTDGISGVLRYNKADCGRIPPSAQTVSPVRDKSLDGVRELCSLTGFTLKKNDILRDNIDFKRVSEEGKAYSSKFFILIILPNGLRITRAGFSINKKRCKLSSGRNRVKRLLRESYRLNKYRILKGFDFIFVAKTSGKDLNFKIVEEEMINLFKKAGILPQILPNLQAKSA